MKQKYSEAFIEQAVVKLLSRGKRTVREVALELNVSYHTAKNWMKRGYTDRTVTPAGKEKRPQDWSASEQLQALNETHALSSEALHAWRRERGVFAHHLSSWKTAFCAPAKALADTGPWRSLKDENEQLKRELLRKEKALSEAAALLMLQKKFRALWEDEVK
jgi:transposase